MKRHTPDWHRFGGLVHLIGRWVVLWTLYGAILAYDAPLGWKNSMRGILHRKRIDWRIRNACATKAAKHAYFPGKGSHGHSVVRRQKLDR